MSAAGNPCNLTLSAEVFLRTNPKLSESLKACPLPRDQMVDFSGAARSMGSFLKRACAAIANRRGLGH